MSPYVLKLPYCQSILFIFAAFIGSISSISLISIIRVALYSTVTTVFTRYSLELELPRVVLIIIPISP